MDPRVIHPRSPCHGRQQFVMSENHDANVNVPKTGQIYLCLDNPLTVKQASFSFIENLSGCSGL